MNEELDEALRVADADREKTWIGPGWLGKNCQRLMRVLAAEVRSLRAAQAQEIKTLKDEVERQKRIAWENGDASRVACLNWERVSKDIAAKDRLLAEQAEKLKVMGEACKAAEDSEDALVEKVSEQAAVIDRAEASLAELRKRMGEAEKEYRARFLGELWTLLPERSHGYNDIVRYVQQASTAALASPPSPAPLPEEKPSPLEAARSAVIEAAKYIGTEHSAYCSTVGCNCSGHAKRRKDLADALARLFALSGLAKGGEKE